MKTNWLKRLFKRKPQPTRRIERIPVPADKVRELAEAEDKWSHTRQTPAWRTGKLDIMATLAPITQPIRAALPKGSRWTTHIDWEFVNNPVVVMDIEIPPEEE